VPDLCTVDEALARVLERTVPLAAERVATPASLGRVLREAVVSAVALPPFPSSAMDGYAVRAEDTPGVLPIAFRVAAGSPAASPLPAGAAAGVATGGVVPDGANAVVPIEDVREMDAEVAISAATAAGRNVRPRGGDVVPGDLVLEAGTRVSASHIGALSAVGVGEVVCSARPRVAVIATGSELRAAGEDLLPGQIYESNRAMLAAAISTTGAQVEVLPVVEDKAKAHAEVLERALAADVVVSSGGVSVGPHDLVRRVARGLGVEEVFWGVAVKPGKPLSFGTKGRTLVFGLPGNPVSSLVCAVVFVRTALWALQGRMPALPEYEPGRTPVALARNAHRDEFIRARRRIDGESVVLEPLSGQESHMIVHAAAADALVHVPRGDDAVPAGSPVRYLNLV